MSKLVLRREFSFGFKYKWRIIQYRNYADVSNSFKSSYSSNESKIILKERNYNQVYPFGYDQKYSKSQKNAEIYEIISDSIQPICKYTGFGIING